MTTVDNPPRGERRPLAVAAIQPEQDVGWLEELLREVGFTLHRTSSGQEARALARTATPELIIIGSQLGGVSGLETCRTLRDDPQLSPATPIVLLMPNGTARLERLAALRAGAWQCIDAASDREELLIRLGIWRDMRRRVEESAAEGLLDPVTQLYNRQGLARRAREIAADAARRRKGLACVVFAIEVDPRAEPTEAKTPAVVRATADVLRARVRLSDALGRLVQGEFAVIAPTANGGSVEALIDRLSGHLQEGFMASGAGLPPTYLKVAHTVAPNLKYAPVDPVRLLGLTSAAVAHTAPRWWHRGRLG